MAPKKVTDKVEARTTLAAVVLADSFTQVFVFCCAHAEQIRKYIETSKWSRTHSIKVTTIISTNCLSAGEALRLIDQRDIIKSDFVLVTGDTVASLALGPALAEHRARREQHKSAIMTMIMKPVKNPRQRMRLGDTDLIVAVDPASKQLLKYMELEPSTSGAIKIDTAFFSERDAAQIRSDLMDTHICICAPEVLMLFSDNFDYQNIKRDFVSGVLSEEELGNKLYIYEVQGEYAARVHNLRSYDAISRDIMQRWTFPFVPDTNVLFKTGTWGPSKFSYSRGNRYLEPHISIARTATIGNDVCIGAGSAVGEGSNVCQSSIGRDCRLGKNVDIVGCYIGDGVTIHEGCKLRYVLVCDRAVIRSGASVSHGAIISYGVVIGPKHSVPPYSRISLCRQVQREVNLSDDELEYAGAGGDGGGGNDSDDDSSQRVQTSSHERPSAAAVHAAEAIALGRPTDGSVRFEEEVVGTGGAGFLWSAVEGYDVRRFSIAPPPEDNGLEPATADEAVVGDDKVGEEGAVSGDDENEAPDPEVAWKREVSETFLRCVKMGFKHENVILELNNLKIAEVRTFADVARYVFTTLMGLCLPVPRYLRAEYSDLFPREAPSASAQAELFKSFKEKITKWKAILKQYLRDTDDQIELLLTLEEFCAMEGAFEGSDENGQYFAGIFQNVLQLLYDEDVLTEEAILAWADEKDDADAEDRLFLDKAKKFLDWLRTADEEDEEEDEDEDEDED